MSFVESDHCPQNIETSIGKTIAAVLPSLKLIFSFSCNYCRGLCCWLWSWCKSRHWCCYCCWSCKNEFVVAYLYEAKTYKSVELFLLSPAILFAHVADIFWRWCFGCIWLYWKWWLWLYCNFRRTSGLYRYRRSRSSCGCWSSCCCSCYRHCCRCPCRRCLCRRGCSECVVIAQAWTKANRFWLQNRNIFELIRFQHKH